MDRLRVLVTGAGGGVGQGIMKALRIAELPITLIAADIDPLNAGLYRADEAILIPRVEEEGAYADMVKSILSADADIVLVGSEFDLDFMAAHRSQIEAETKAIVVVSPLDTVRLAADKWLTTQFLRDNRLPHAEANLPANFDEAAAIADSWGFPIVVKARQGTASRHVHVVNNHDQLVAAVARTPNPMLQKPAAEIRPGLSNEYTCSIFRGANGELLGPFTARRSLRGGSSWVVEVDEFAECHELLISIAEHLDFQGSMNVQLMIGDNGPVPFEFNARFSGTTHVRAHYGFNEPELAIRSYLLGEALRQPKVGRGVALRYIEEVFVDGISAHDLALPFPHGTVRQWF